MAKSTTLDSVFDGTAKPDSMLKQITKRLIGKDSKVFPFSISRGGKIKLSKK